MKFESKDPAAEQPPIMNRIVIKLNEGGKYNSSKFPRCNLATLQSKGPKGCPSELEDRHRHRYRLRQAGRDRPGEREADDLQRREVGGKDTILVYVFPDLGPTFVSVGKIKKKRAGGFDYNLDFNIPPIKTLPSAPDAATALVDTKTPKKTIKKGKQKFSLIVTPKKCKGTWKAEGQFFFADG